MDAEHDASLVRGVVLVGREQLALARGRRAHEAAADGVALGDFRRDERKGRPHGHGPGDADEADEHRGERHVAHEERRPHAAGEEEVRVHPEPPQR